MLHRILTLDGYTHYDMKVTYITMLLTILVLITCIGLSAALFPYNVKACDGCDSGFCESSGNCVPKCQSRTNTTNDTGACIGQCARACPPGRCALENCSVCFRSTCVVCQPGFYGQTCQRECMTTCHGDGRCDLYEGRCLRSKLTFKQCFKM